MDRKRGRDRPVSLDVANYYNCQTEYCTGKMNLALGYRDSFVCSVCSKTNCMRCRGIHLDCVLCNKNQSTWNKTRKVKAKVFMEYLFIQIKSYCCINLTKSKPVKLSKFSTWDINITKNCII